MQGCVFHRHPQHLISVGCLPLIKDSTTNTTVLAEKTVGLGMVVFSVFRFDIPTPDDEKLLRALHYYQPCEHLPFFLRRTNLLARPFTYLTDFVPPWNDLPKNGDQANFEELAMAFGPNTWNTVFYKFPPVEWFLHSGTVYLYMVRRILNSAEKF